MGVNGLVPSQGSEEMTGPHAGAGQSEGRSCPPLVYSTPATYYSKRRGDSHVDVRACRLRADEPLLGHRRPLRDGRLPVTILFAR